MSTIILYYYTDHILPECADTVFIDMNTTQLSIGNHEVHKSSQGIHLGQNHAL